MGITEKSNTTKQNTAPLAGEEQMVSGEKKTRGTRPNMEDMCRVGHIHTAGGLSLTLAIVADGVGGNSFGEVAAEMTVATVFEEVEHAPINAPDDLPEVLKAALERANEKVYQRSRTEKDKKGMACTAVVAAVAHNKLYFANVGDSRLYFYAKAKNDNEPKLHQLTLDHSWAHEMVLQKRLTKEEAAKHPKAEELVHSIGFESTVMVDLGCYMEGIDTPEERRNRQGIPLTTNARLVLCSDGLVKPRHNNPQAHYVEPAEIVQAITTRIPQEACDQLIAKVDERQGDDNATVIVLEMPGSKHSSAALATLREKWQMVAGGAAGVLLLLLLAGGAMAFGGGGAPEVTATVTQPALAQVTEPPETTPELPTNTPPPLVTGWPAGIEVYPGPNTTLPEPSNPLVLASGIVVVTSAGTTNFTVKNQFGTSVLLYGAGLMGVIVGDQFIVHCFTGECYLQGEVAGEVTLKNGEASTVGSNGQPGNPVPAQVELFAFASVVPTATPTPTPTNTPTATPTPTNTPTPRPTNTPTATPVTPTATPVTPDAPQPPGNTPQPSTATPEAPSPTPCPNDPITNLPKCL